MARATPGEASGGPATEDLFARLGREHDVHKQVLDEYRASLKSTLKAVPDLARFTAALERLLRAESGGGSMSTRLFVGETLTDVSIAGTKAWATRRGPDGHAGDVGFVRKKGEWYIRPLAKRPAASRG